MWRMEKGKVIKYDVGIVSWSRYNTKGLVRTAQKNGDRKTCSTRARSGWKVCACKRENEILEIDRDIESLTDKNLLEVKEDSYKCTGKMYSF